MKTQKRLKQALEKGLPLPRSESVEDMNASVVGGDGATRLVFVNDGELSSETSEGKRTL